MFNKKECKKCKKKVKENYDFCPYCGNLMNENSRQDWGMLGKNDEVKEKIFSNSIFGGVNENMLNKMLGGAMRMLQKEMQKEFNNSQPRANFRLMINGKEVDLGNMQGKKTAPVKKKKVKIPSNFSAENLKRFSSLPREEPKTNMKRLADKVIYEIELNGVESIEDIILIRLENSIEIKAVAKDKSYSKTIPINLPIISCNLSEGKLVLEFEVKA